MARLNVEQFRAKDLELALEDLRDNKVRVKFTGAAFYGTVSGGNSGIVRIPFRDEDGFGRMICNCADARKSRKCRHMAAVMLAICSGDYDSADVSYGEIRERIDPFLPEEFQEYDYDEVAASEASDPASTEDLPGTEDAAIGRKQRSGAGSSSISGAGSSSISGTGSSIGDSGNSSISGAGSSSISGTGSSIGDSGSSSIGDSGSSSISGAGSNKTSISNTGSSPDVKTPAKTTAAKNNSGRGNLKLALNWRGNPFKASSREEGIYYDLHRIMAPYEVTGETMSKARQLLAANKVDLATVNLAYIRDGDNEQCLQVKGICEGAYQDVIVTAVMTRQKLVQIECRSYNCFYNLSTYSLGSQAQNSNYGPCEHQMAVLLLLEEYILANNPGDATNYAADSVLARFQNHYGKTSCKGAEPAASRAPVVQLQPRLLREGSTYELGFRIGKNKLYMLKDMPALLETYDERGQMTLGKNNTLDFAGEDFDEESLAWLQLIRRNVLEAADMEAILEKRLENRYYSLPSELRLAPKKSITLHGSVMDEFFQTALSLGRPLEYEGTNRQKRWYGRSSSKEKDKRSLTPRDERLHLQLTMTPSQDEEGDFLGVNVTGELPEFKFGTDFFYYISERYLNRVPISEADLLRPFLENRKKDGSIFMQFGRRSMAPLFHHILPELEPLVSVDIVEEETLEAFIPPEAEFVFWMDADADVVTCRPEAVYGEKRYNLTERMDTAALPDPQRDVHREDAILDRLTDYFDTCDPRPAAGLFYFQRDDDMLFQLLDTGLHVLMQLGAVHTTDRFDRLKLRHKPQISVGVTVGSKLMNLSILSDDMDLQELLDVLHSYREKRPYHRLKNGDFLRLDDPTLGELSDMMDAMHITAKEFVKGKMHLPAYRALYLDRMLEDAEGLYAERDHRFRQMVKEFKTVSDSDFEAPASLQHVLRNYQKVGFQWLKTVDAYGFGGVLADEMGLGKTLQVIVLLLSAKEAAEAASAKAGASPAPLHPSAEDASAAGAAEDPDPAPLPDDGRPRSLIVTPASLVYNWQEEFHKFAPGMDVCVIAGGQKTRQKQLEAFRASLSGIGDSPAEPDVLITSYDLLKRDIDLYEGLTFDYEIIDEAQFIKNHTTAAAKAVKVVRAVHRFALTGTPIENRLSELWSIFDFLMPGFLYGYETFRKEFETPIAKRDDEVARRQLKRMVSPFILRRLKQDVLTDLPEKLEEIRYVSFESKQRKVYDGQVVHMKQMLASQSPDDFARNKIQILAELTRIRQICCDPALLLEDYKGASAKREAVIDLIGSAAEAGHKMLVFSQFTSMLALLERDLAKAGQPFYKITGETPKLKRTELVRAFNEDDTPVFLISLKAGGTGLNLTGADIVIHYDPWWNLAVQNQATDRAHRIGQKKTVTVYRMIAKGTIEEKIVEIQKSKKELAEEILSGETGGLTQMSRDDLLNLL